MTRPFSLQVMPQRTPSPSTWLSNGSKTVWWTSWLSHKRAWWWTTTVTLLPMWALKRRPTCSWSSMLWKLKLLETLFTSTPRTQMFFCWLSVECHNFADMLHSSWVLETTATQSCCSQSMMLLPSSTGMRWQGVRPQGTSEGKAR